MLAPVYFLSFIVATTFVLLNLIIAILVDNFERDESVKLERQRKQFLKERRKVRQREIQETLQMEAIDAETTGEGVVTLEGVMQHFSISKAAAQVHKHPSCAFLKYLLPLTQH